MTREEIFNMPAGPEMDAAVVRELGIPADDGNPINHPLGGFRMPYSTSDAAAIEVLRAFIPKIHVRLHFDPWSRLRDEEDEEEIDDLKYGPRWFCLLEGKGTVYDADGDFISPSVDVCAPTLALAICRAALISKC